MKLKIVELEIKDTEIGEVQDTYYLVNPDLSKLAELKHMVEHRFDYGFEEGMTDEEIADAELFCDNIWDNINKFIADNFVTLDIEETYEIAY